MQRYGQMKKTYKTVGILLFVVFILTLHAAAEEGRYASRISKEDCFFLVTMEELRMLNTGDRTM